MTPPWEIRPLRAGDVEAVYTLERAMEQAAHWPEEEYLRMVEPSVARPRSGHVQRLACVAMARGKLIGFAAGRVVVGEGEIENIAVAADYRRQGVAAALVAALLASCRRAGATVVRLEVRASNAAAQTLYQTAGFQVENIRKLYYHSPQEDALVMVKHLASAR